jgi:hypothetical protein
MLALVGLAGLLLALAVVSGWRGTHRLTSRSDDTHAVEQAATDFVEAYGTFDFRDSASYQERLLALTTGQVRQAVLAAAVDPAAVAQQQTMTSHVTAVTATAMSDSEATTSVTATQTKRSVDPATGVLSDQQTTEIADCRLVKEGGSWRVAELHIRSAETQPTTN